jgi:hypothetical protein
MLPVVCPWDLPKNTVHSIPMLVHGRLPEVPQGVAVDYVPTAELHTTTRNKLKSA